MNPVLASALPSKTENPEIVFHLNAICSFASKHKMHSSYHLVTAEPPFIHMHQIIHMHPTKPKNSTLHAIICYHPVIITTSVMMSVTVSKMGLLRRAWGESVVSISGMSCYLNKC